MKINRILLILNVLVTAQAFAQPPKTATDYFKRLPVSAFDDTTEGMTEADKADLILKGDSSSWTLKKVSDRKIVMTCKTPTSEVTLTVKRLDGEVLETLSKNQQAIKYGYWKLSEDGLSLQSHFPSALIHAANETSDGSEGVALTVISKELKKHIQTLEMCAHWSGEPNEEPARAQEILKNIKALGCEQLPENEKLLRVKLKGDPKSIGVLDRAKSSIESGN